ncbi:MAG: indole-3-glycerol phosphate synthase TrpC [Gemmatimonadota bacterium]
MSGFLERMAASSAQRARLARDHTSAAELLRRAEAQAPPRPIHLHERFDLISEIKFRSPAEGALGQSGGGSATPLQRAGAYEQGGAACLSVLTEPLEFHGSLEHLEQAVAAVDVPVMRKDFLVDVHQVLEARAAGASGVLLIARILSDAALDELCAAAHALGLFVLAEAFDEVDLERIGRVLSPARSSGSGPVDLLVGVNTRDLTTLAVDPARLSRVRPALPADWITVAESGITHPADAAEAARLGYRMALVGSALMRSDDPRSTVEELLAAGRGATT